MSEPLYASRTCANSARPARKIRLACDVSPPERNLAYPFPALSARSAINVSASDSDNTIPSFLTERTRLKVTRRIVACAALRISSALSFISLNAAINSAMHCWVLAEKRDSSLVSVLVFIINAPVNADKRRKIQTANPLA